MSDAIGNRRWWTLGLFFLCYTVLYMARASVSMAGPSMISFYGWSKTEFGLVSTAFFLGYASTMVLGGILADKFGGGRVLCVAAVLWSVFVFITPLPLGIPLVLMIVVRAGCGMAQGVALPSMTSMIAKWVPKKESGVAQGVSLIGVAAGLAITMPLAAWVINTWGWQKVFYAFSILGPIWVLIWIKFGYQSPAEDPNISSAELNYIHGAAAASAAQAATVSADDPDQMLTAKEAYAQPAVWFGAISFLCTHFLFYLFMTWLPTYFADGRGLSVTGSAVSSMLPYVAAMFTYPIGGLLADKCAAYFGDNIGRKIHPCVGLIASAVLLYLATQAASTMAATALVSASNGFLCLTMGGFYSIPIVFSKRHAGKLVGLWATFASVGGILAPTVTGVLVDKYGYDFALSFGAGTAVLGALMLVFVRVAPFGEAVARKRNA